MGIQCGVLVLRAHLQPSGQVFAVAGIQGMEREYRERKVVNPVPAVCETQRNGVVFVDLRQDLHAPGLHPGLDPVQQLPDLRCFEETAPAGFLHRIGKGIQPDH